MGRSAASPAGDLMSAGGLHLVHRPLLAPSYPPSVDADLPSHSSLCVLPSSSLCCPSRTRSLKTHDRDGACDTVDPTADPAGWIEWTAVVSRGLPEGYQILQEDDSSKAWRRGHVQSGCLRQRGQCGCRHCTDPMLLLETIWRWVPHGIAHR